jgi:hypothetical protein
MTKELQKLLEAPLNFLMSPEQKEEQQRSFVLGNTSIENRGITRAMVNKLAEALKGKQSAKDPQGREELRVAGLVTLLIRNDTVWPRVIFSVTASS